MAKSFQFELGENEKFNIVVEFSFFGGYTILHNGKIIRENFIFQDSHAFEIGDKEKHFVLIQPIRTIFGDPKNFDVFIDNKFLNTFTLK